MLQIQSFESKTNRWKRKLQNIFVNYFHSHTKVLLYHRVNNIVQDPLQLSVTPDNFYKQLIWLKKKYRIISIDELSESILKKKKIEGKTIVITFDDGYADNFNIALPILEDLRIPAAFFITTSLLNSNEELWWDELNAIILQNNNLPEKIIFEQEDTSNERYVFYTANKYEAFSNIHDLLKFASLEVRNRITASLRKQAKINNENNNLQNRLMRFDELQKMSRSPQATIGAHTVNHISLGVQQTVDQQNEIQNSKAFLEQIINKPVNYFSYPYGTTKDFNNNTIQLVKNAGFDLGFANYHGFATHDTHHYKIPRILVRNFSPRQLNKVINKPF